LMVSPTYKHLDAKMRLGGLQLGQWAQLAAALGAAALFGIYLSPLPPGPTVAVSVFVAGLPVAVSFAAMGLEFSVGSFGRAVWRWWRAPRRYIAGGGTAANGYAVTTVMEIRAGKPAMAASASGQLAELWDC